MRKKSEDMFFTKAKNIHSNLYDYSAVNYITSSTKVKIICKRHGIFTQNPSDHIYEKAGCPKCRDSKGEKYINLILSGFKFRINRQYSFLDCKNKRPLKFDFYLPDYNTCIEFDGQQHFKPWYKFGIVAGNNLFKKTQKCDSIKTNYCKKNNINLLRIKFNDNVEEKLMTFINHLQTRK